MCSYEEIRFKLHERLIAMDASTIELLKLVALGFVGSNGWREAVGEHRSNLAELESTLEEQAAFQKSHPNIHCVS